MLFSLFYQCRKVLQSLWPPPAVRLNKKAARLLTRGKPREDWRNEAVVKQKWLGGSIALKQEDYRQAIEQFDAALEAIDQSHDFHECTHKSARLYHDRGLAWHWLGEYENALRDVDEALRLNPENERYLHYRARLLFACDRIEEAADTYEAALAQRCEAKREWTHKQTADRNSLGGSISLEQGNYRQAISRSTRPSARSAWR